MSLVVVPRVLLEQLREFTFMFDSGRAGVLRGHIGLALAKAGPDDVPVVGLFSQASGFGPWVEGDHGEPLVRQSDHLAALAAVTAERDSSNAKLQIARTQLEMTLRSNVQLRAEVEALRNDAERYRWLTDGKRGDYCWNNVLSENQRSRHEDLEPAIDAAMAAKEA